MSYWLKDPAQADLARSDRSPEGQGRLGHSTCCWTAKPGEFSPPIPPVVVLTRDGEDSRWRNLGVADAAYVAVVRRLVAFAPQWRGPQGMQRVEFFLPLFGHENSTIHELAYLELARAPSRDDQTAGPRGPA